MFGSAPARSARARFFFLLVCVHAQEHAKAMRMRKKGRQEAMSPGIGSGQAYIVMAIYGNGLKRERQEAMSPGIRSDATVVDAEVVVCCDVTLSEVT